MPITHFADQIRSDAAVFTGTRAELADFLAGWHSLGVDGACRSPANHHRRPFEVLEAVDAFRERRVVGRQG